jgi:hypothetical protein
MVEDAVELVEAVHGGQVFVAVAEMVLADLRSGIAVGLEEFGNGRILVLDTLLCRGQADGQKTGAEWRLPEDEGGTPGRAGLLGIVIGEQRAFLGDAVDVRRAPAHHPSMVGADVPDADIVGHDHHDVWPLLRRWRRLRARRRGQRH